MSPSSSSRFARHTPASALYSSSASFSCAVPARGRKGRSGGLSDDTSDVLELADSRRTGGLSEDTSSVLDASSAGGLSEDTSSVLDASSAQRMAKRG